MMIIGHEKQREWLEKIFDRRRIPHALFFWGPNEVGKETVARAFAKGMLCDKETAWGCETCGACTSEAIQTHQILFLSDETEETGETDKRIGIDAVRSLIERASRTSLTKKPLITIIDGAERLTPEAANALLNILEEPPDTVFFIMTAETKESVLPTILSRSFALHFFPIPAHTLEEAAMLMMPSLPAERRTSIVRFAQGRPGRLICALNDETVLKNAQKKYSAAFNLLSSPIHSALKTIDGIIKHEEPIAEYMEYMANGLRSLFLISYVPDHPAALKIDPRMFTSFRNRYAPERYPAIFRNLFRADMLIRTTNANSRIAFENFIIQL